ncbi:MAG: PEP-utilizing enzyme, partial [Endomicrobia bacterium]|nr:PEP-utilizing enzyme [Endomicrobiia bacterium]
VDVFKSFYSDRAIDDMITTGVAVEPALIIQEWVDFSKSGIAALDGDILTINGAYGECEGIAQGSVPADHIVLKIIDFKTGKFEVKEYRRANKNLRVETNEDGAGVLKEVTQGQTEEIFNKNELTTIVKSFGKIKEGLRIENPEVELGFDFKNNYKLVQARHNVAAESKKTVSKSIRTDEREAGKMVIANPDENNQNQKAAVSKEEFFKTVFSGSLEENILFGKVLSCIVNGNEWDFLAAARSYDEKLGEYIYAISDSNFRDAVEAAFGFDDIGARAAALSSAFKSIPEADEKLLNFLAAVSESGISNGLGGVQKDDVLEYLIEQLNSQLPALAEVEPAPFVDIIILKDAAASKEYVLNTYKTLHSLNDLAALAVIYNNAKNDLNALQKEEIISRVSAFIKQVDYDALNAAEKIRYALITSVFETGAENISVTIPDFFNLDADTLLIWMAYEGINGVDVLAKEIMRNIKLKTTASANGHKILLAANSLMPVSAGKDDEKAVAAAKTRNAALSLLASEKNFYKEISKTVRYFTYMLEKMKIDKYFDSADLIRFKNTVKRLNDLKYINSDAEAGEVFRLMSELNDFGQIAQYNELKDLISKTVEHVRYIVRAEESERGFGKANLNTGLYIPAHFKILEKLPQNLSVKTQDPVILNIEEADESKKNANTTVEKFKAFERLLENDSLALAEMNAANDAVSINNTIAVLELMISDLGIIDADSGKFAGQALSKIKNVIAGGLTDEKIKELKSPKEWKERALENIKEIHTLITAVHRTSFRVMMGEKGFSVSGVRKITIKPDVIAYDFSDKEEVSEAEMEFLSLLAGFDNKLRLAMKDGKFIFSGEANIHGVDIIVDINNTQEGIRLNYNDVNGAGIKYIGEPLELMGMTVKYMGSNNSGYTVCKLQGVYGNADKLTAAREYGLKFLELLKWEKIRAIFEYNGYGIKPSEKMTIKTPLAEDDKELEKIYDYLGIEENNRNFEEITRRFADGRIIVNEKGVLAPSAVIAVSEPQSVLKSEIADQLRNDKGWKQMLLQAATIDSLGIENLSLRDEGNIGRADLKSGVIRVKDGFVSLKIIQNDDFKAVMSEFVNFNGKREKLTDERLRELLQNEGFVLAAKDSVDKKEIEEIKLSMEDVGPRQKMDAGEAKGLGVSEGIGEVVSGRAVYDREKLKEGDIWITGLLGSDDISELSKAGGFIQTYGGRLSHIAITAREDEKPGVLLPPVWRDGKLVINGVVVEEGMQILLDGQTGIVLAFDESLKEEKIKKMQVFNDEIIIRKVENTLKNIPHIKNKNIVYDLLAGAQERLNKITETQENKGTLEKLRNEIIMLKEKNAAAPNVFSAVKQAVSNAVEGFAVSLKDLFDTQVYGAKAVNLANAARILKDSGIKGVSVPDGFALSKEFLDSDEKTLQEWADENLEDGVLYAVRSSGVGEDGKEFAYAGQAETMLNVSKADIVKNIRKVQESFSSKRSVEYMAKNNLKVIPAVFVQKMVKNQVAGGQIFTRNSEGNSEIEAVRGLGEGAVSNKVSPDRFEIRESDKLITGKKADERLTKVVESETGTKMALLNAQEKANPVLTEKMTLKLKKIADILEKAYGYPLDIEFAIDADGIIHILQVRPITTFAANALMPNPAVFNNISETLFDNDPIKSKSLERLLSAS